MVDLQGRDVPFFLESFSPRVGEARIRTLVPQAVLGEKRQVLRVRWGDPLAEPREFPDQVFSRAKGWAGVWDLRRTYWDAARRWRVSDPVWGDDGLLTGSLAADPEGGLRFSQEGTAGWAASGKGVDFDRSFTVVWRMRPQAKGCVFLGLGDSLWRAGRKEFYLQDPKVSIRAAGWNPGFVARSDTDFNVYSTSQTTLDPDAWTTLAARYDISGRDSAMVEWFRDGVATGQATTGRLRFQGDLDRDSMVIGWRHSQARRFAGTLAELWVLQRPVSNEWIRVASLLLSEKPGLVAVRR